MSLDPVYKAPAAASDLARPREDSSSSLPAAVRNLVTPTARPVFATDDKGHQEFRGDNASWHPVPLDDNRLALAEAALHDAEAAAPAGPREAVMWELYLLRHQLRGRSANDEVPVQVEQAIASQWAEDMAVYPLDVVREACRRWRRSSKWRPTPSDMISLCDTVMMEWHADLVRLRRLVAFNRALGEERNYRAALRWWNRIPGVDHADRIKAARKALGQPQARLRDVALWCYRNERGVLP